MKVIRALVSLVGVFCSILSAVFVVKTLVVFSTILISNELVKNIAEVVLIGVLILLFERCMRNLSWLQARFTLKRIAVLLVAAFLAFVSAEVLSGIASVDTIVAGFGKYYQLTGVTLPMYTISTARDIVGAMFFPIALGYWIYRIEYSFDRAVSMLEGMKFSIPGKTVRQT